MPLYEVIVRRGGQIQLLAAGEAAERALDELTDDDVHLGSFAAENEQEAWRQLATTNPSVDMEKRRVAVSADAGAALAEQKAEFEEKVRQDAIDALELPDDTGAEIEEVEEEVEEDDPDRPGEKKKSVRKVKKARGAGSKAKSAKATAAKSHKK